jgi:hypothetical protein
LPFGTGIPGLLPTGLVLDPNTPISTRLTASNTGFAMMAGGGLDIKISKHMSFRPIGADYYLTRVPSFVTGNTANREQFSLLAGVNFLIGGQR